MDSALIHLKPVRIYTIIPWKFILILSSYLRFGLHSNLALHPTREHESCPINTSDAASM